MAELLEALRETRSDVELFLVSFSMLDKQVITTALVETAFLVTTSLKTVEDYEAEFARRGLKVKHWQECEYLRRLALLRGDCVALVAIQEDAQQRERIEFCEADEIRARSLGIKLSVGE